MNRKNEEIKRKSEKSIKLKMNRLKIGQSATTTPTHPKHQITVHPNTRYPNVCEKNPTYKTETKRKRKKKKQQQPSVMGYLKRLERCINLCTASIIKQLVA